MTDPDLEDDFGKMPRPFVVFGVPDDLVKKIKEEAERREISVNKLAAPVVIEALQARFGK